jgi:hypothetical protein
MSLLLKAAVFGGIAYAITRALRNPNVQEALDSGSQGRGSFKSDLHPDEAQWPSGAQQSNTGPSS